ncbi:MAG: GNAT family N-acetyltransferase [Bacillota bacterium]|jgi:GNAT superfamily N-acetyltransferase|nr:GNAT family N-acetyltransferase [Bacillota bacterium]
MPLIRPATRGDRDSITGFCRNTFDWGDYIEEVIDGWLDSSEGVLLTALHEGRPAGIARVVMITPREAWFEGLRVDKEFRRLGLGAALTAACIQEARQRGAEVAMMAVDACNAASLRLSERAGFRCIARFREMGISGARGAQARCGPEAGVRLATTDDVPALETLFQSVEPGGLVFVNWEVVRWGPEIVRDIIERSRLWVFDSGSGPCAAALVKPEEGALEVSSLCGYPQGMEQILRSAGHFAALHSCGRAYLWCLEGGADERAAVSAGCVDSATGEAGDGLLLLEMRLD